jgi:3-oxosteroid 1-dehydrogenase
LAEVEFHHDADVVVLGLGAAGGCAAIGAHDSGADVIVIEKQAKDRHYSNTRMSGGGFHSPKQDGNFEALKAYAKAMFSGDGLPLKLEPEMPEFADDLAEIWAREAPKNESFMRSLDPMFQTINMANAAFPEFPGAADAGYAVVRSSYTGSTEERVIYSSTKDLDKSKKNAGEAFHACLMTGVTERGIKAHYGISGRRLVLGLDGEVVGVSCLRGDRIVNYRARRAVIICTGGYEYNKSMRKAFLDGPAAEGWAFYGSPANTGDGIEMALRIGAGLSKAGSVAGRMICAIPERRRGLKIGLNTNGVGKPNEIVVDSYGRRFASERRITKDPSRYIFYKEALQFDTIALDYPRIPAWMIFDESLREKGPVVWTASAAYNSIEWGDDNLAAVDKGWILKGETLDELAEKIRRHPDSMRRMDTGTLKESVARFNAHCANGVDPDFEREPQTLGPVEKAPFYAIPLYPGGPNTKGGLLVNAQRQVLDWEGNRIPRLYAVGEIASVFQFVYQGGGNLAEGITFGRLAGRLAAAEPPTPAQ